MSPRQHPPRPWLQGPKGFQSSLQQEECCPARKEDSVESQWRTQSSRRSWLEEKKAAVKGASAHCSFLLRDAYLPTSTFTRAMWRWQLINCQRAMWKTHAVQSVLQSGLLFCFLLFVPVLQHNHVSTFVVANIFHRGPFWVKACRPAGGMQCGGWHYRQKAIVSAPAGKWLTALCSCLNTGSLQSFFKRLVFNSGSDPWRSGLVF